MTEKIVAFRTGKARDAGELGQGKLGIALSREITPDVVQKFRLRSTSGALVTQVPPSSAGAAAGLREGDFIKSLNGITLRDAQDLVDRIKGLAGGSRVELGVNRKGEWRQLSGRLGVAAGKVRSVFTIGHPAGNEWSWQSGFVLSNANPNFLAISPSLVTFGVSGGPLFDDRYNVIGIAVRQADRNDTALRIESVLEKLAQWQIPYQSLFASDFCNRFQKVLDQRDSDFAGIRRGAGRPSLGRTYEKHVWGATIDLSGRNKSRVVLTNRGDYEFKAEMRDRVGIEEGELVLREIASEIKKCLPDSYLEKNRWGFKITFKKGFWDSPRVVEVLKFGSIVELQIP